MYKGLDRYSIRGRSVVTSRSTYDNKEVGAHVSRSREIASSNTTSSSMAMGGLTAEDLSLGYIGGSSSQKGGGGSKSNAPPEIYKYYDAIFREDSICGAAIELRANIPYGDFTIHGVDKARQQKYEEAIDNMRLRTIMPRIAIERDVQGAFLGMLDWNAGKQTYDSMLPYSRQHATNVIYPIVHGMDPVVTIDLNDFLVDIVKSQDPRLADIKKNIPKFLLNGNLSNVPVPMDSIVWVDRPHSDPRFNSALHRILPVFLIERAITRGTIEAAHRRQRGILHITAGNGDSWLASNEEMKAVAELFTNADADPLGAIVVTREGISPNEVRNPTDFWRITDSYDQTVSFKLRALGVSEAFLSGDATFNNAEVAISTFLQTIKTERAQVTDQLLYRKIFLQLARGNDFMIKGAGRERGFDEQQQLLNFNGMSAVEIAANSVNSINNINLYDTPKITWKQSLMPEGDQAYIELLNTLAERNVPAPIRTMFAAGGLDFDSIMDNTNQDLEDRKKLAKYIETIRDIMPKPEMEGQDMGGGGDEFARYDLAPDIGILNRSYEDASSEACEPWTEVGGKRTRPMTVQGKKMLREKQTKEFAHALARIAETHNAKVRAGVED